MNGRVSPVVGVIAALGLFVVGMIGYAAFASQRAPSGPVEPVADKQACSHCRMHLGEPAFVAELQTASGDVLFYDDPGCLARHLEDGAPAPVALWFRHFREKRWLDATHVGFVPTTPTPMGFGYGAVDASEPGALDWKAFCTKLARDGRSKR